jgi:hypothetical protein
MMMHIGFFALFLSAFLCFQRFLGTTQIIGMLAALSVSRVNTIGPRREYRPGQKQ